MNQNEALDNLWERGYRSTVERNMLFLALKKVWLVKITPRQIFTTRWKNSCPYLNFLTPSPHWEERFIPYLFNAVWKTMACFFFPSQGLQIISAYLLVWLGSVTQTRNMAVYWAEHKTLNLTNFERTSPFSSPVLLFALQCYYSFVLI